MAGIEHLEVHSRSYIVRWVQVEDGNTLSWSVQPHKKSINFGIVKHPGSGATTILPSTGDKLSAGGPQLQNTSEGKSGRLVPKAENTAQDLLASKGFIPIRWCGKCEADKVSMGTHDVQSGNGGMYGLVFDNTFSKQTSKTATFVILTYPTGAPPQTTNHLPNLQLNQARGSQTSLGKHAGPHLEGGASGSTDSLHSHGAGGRPRSASGRSEGEGAGHYHVGSLSKRRRKKGQGYARRFFSLDYSTCTLSYYHNRQSSALRGAIPLSLAAVAADERRREISIDSGAEVWHLRAPNKKEFQEWARALERASRVARGLEIVPQPMQTRLAIDTGVPKTQRPPNQDEDREWQQVEALVSRVVGTRDALRRLTKDIAAQTTSSGSSQFLTPGSASGSEEKGEGYFTPQVERRPFWRRKSSTPSGATVSALQHATPSALAVPSPGAAKSLSGSRKSKRSSGTAVQEEKSLQDHCQALLTDLDSVVAEFTTLIGNSKRRRLPIPMSAGAVSRKSIDTVSTTEEFFDAEDANSRVVKIGGSDDEDPESDEEGSFQDNSSVSSVGDDDEIDHTKSGHLFPTKPKSLAPLPIDEPLERRVAIPSATVPPPSIYNLIRKNVGKDLSTIAMPVSTNEPLSMMQKVAEQLEYAQLLNKAAKQKTPTERLLYVTAFAVSQFSSSRSKERATRKPFTPLLGETFELVRTEQEVPGGFRLLVEKIQHRPVKFAMQADSASWSMSQTPAPAEKFWGKSFEIATDGRVRIVLRLPDGSEELYSYAIATMFLRNVVMGEKYVEPVGTMHVLNDSTGHKATVEFKSKGMFGGRAEEVHVSAFSSDGSNTDSGLTGNWTTSLRTVGPGKAASDEIWRVGKLVDNSAQRYGFTVFAAGLNEITKIEEGKMAPTDSRLRPDQRLAEDGNLDDAEEWKLKLEEAQRTRRKAVEARGDVHKPRWFVKAETAPDGEEVWKIKGGKDGYWEERARGSWTGLEDLFSG